MCSPTTCTELCFPLLEVGFDQKCRKRVDMMALIGFGTVFPLQQSLNSLPPPPLTFIPTLPCSCTAQQVPGGQANLYPSPWFRPPLSLKASRPSPAILCKASLTKPSSLIVHTQPEQSLAFLPISVHPAKFHILTVSSR